MMRATLLLLLMPFACTFADAPPEIDAATGLVIAPGWLHVRANCGGCHSHALVTSQRADRDTWLKMIRWMQATQNLWTLAPDVESELLDYLANAYAPPPATRRAPLPVTLMPAPEAD